METVTGYVTGINGNLANVSFDGAVHKNEVAYILVDGTQVFDGLQNPLPDLAEQCGFFLERGVYLDPIPDRDWEFTPSVAVGDSVEAGDSIGSVPEGLFKHEIMVPFTLKGSDWTVKSIKEKGSYNVRATICVIANSKGEEKELSMVISQPIKQAVKCYDERLRPDEPPLFFRWDRGAGVAKSLQLGVAEEFGRRRPPGDAPHRRRRCVSSPAKRRAPSCGASCRAKRLGCLSPDEGSA